MYRVLKIKVSLFELYADKLKVTKIAYRLICILKLERIKNTKFSSELFPNSPKKTIKRTDSSKNSV